jgi:hypothetical protein
VTSSGAEPEVSVMVDLGISEVRGPVWKELRSDHWSFGMLILSASKHASQLSDIVEVCWWVVAREMSRVDQEIQTHAAC